MIKTKPFTMLGTAALSLSLSLALAACGGADAPAPTSSEAASTPEPAAAANADVIASGTFEGRSDHVTTGGVSVVKTDAGYELILAEDFSLDGAPDPKVGFGNGGTYDAASQVGALRNKTGKQTYALGDTFNAADHTEVYIWCEQFSVPLGVARLAAVQ